MNNFDGVGKKIYGLVGRSLEHSFSRDYFNNKFEKENLDCSYLNFDLPSIDKLSDIIKNYPDLQGFNVTSPYKKSIIQHLDFIDERAKDVGAVNVVNILNDKKLYGFNADVIGFDCLLNIATRGKKTGNAIIFGSGGASRAVQYVLKQKDIPYYIVSRQAGNGYLSYEEINEKGFGGYSLIINATPIGTFPKINDHLPLPFDTFDNHHIVIDLIYNPEETFLLHEAKNHGASTFNGRKMLIEQAEESWKIWNKK